MMWDGVCGLEPPLEVELLWEAVPPPAEGVRGSFLGVMGADLVGVRSLETAAVMSATCRRKMVRIWKCRAKMSIVKVLKSLKVASRYKIAFFKGFEIAIKFAFKG